MIDKVSIKITAGNGGSGNVSFRRERYVPKGGPDGGDGGDGGDAYFVVDSNMATLLDFRSKPEYKAQDGQRGGKKGKTGSSGGDLNINIPRGTLVYEVGDGKETLIGDMIAEDQKSSKLLIAKGGRGGRGNTRFKSSTNQTPTQFTPGTKGEVKEVVLEIKLIADIGLVGLPNAGKSTLLNYLTNARAKTASYPFTTLSPNLGRMILKSGQEIILADIPGLIEGASEGKGLGDEFLRHIERTRILVHLIDPLVHEGDSDSSSLSKVAAKSYKTIRNELKEHKADLEGKPEIVVVNKIDVTEINEALPSIVKTFKKEGIETFGISAVTGEGIDKLENAIMRKLESAPERVVFKSDKAPVKIYTVDTLPNKRIIRS